ncbi:hypothetical protein GCM10023063_18440 [Arthrobacter methylotrophus]|uniref:DUF4237 domain-containing protein n=1 Tax=Arthrobacter methylotrophus TaxID=121291 RepID=A0ABV5UP20_9MICC
MTTSARQPKGVPVGGQFAATAHAEPSVALRAPAVQSEFVTDRLHNLGLLDQLTDDQIHGVTTKLNDSLDFTDRNIEETAELVHFLDHGYSIQTAREAQAGVSKLRELGLTDEADSLELIRTAQVAKALHAPRHALAQAEPVPDGKTEPVPLGDPRLQSGEVFDRVKVHDIVFNHASISGYPQDTQAIRFQANRPLTDAEAYTLSGVVGYANSSAIGGEPLDDPSVGPQRDTPYSFIASIDTNKGRQGNFEKFETMLPELIANGSAPRSTKGGTRAIEPFGDPDLKLEVYYAE